MSRQLKWIEKPGKPFDMRESIGQREDVYANCILRFSAQSLTLQECALLSCLNTDCKGHGTWRVVTSRGNGNE